MNAIAFDICSLCTTYPYSSESHFVWAIWYIETLSYLTWTSNRNFGSLSTMADLYLSCEPCLSIWNDFTCLHVWHCTVYTHVHSWFKNSHGCRFGLDAGYLSSFVHACQEAYDELMKSISADKEKKGGEECRIDSCPREAMVQIGTWRTQFSSNNVAYFNRLHATLLKTLGYGREYIAESLIEAPATDIVEDDEVSLTTDKWQQR